MLDRYMSAIFARDTKAVPTLAADVRMTENTGPMRVGEGLLWRARTEPTSFKVYVADPSGGQVALQTRLKVQGRTAGDRAAHHAGRDPHERHSRRPARVTTDDAACRQLLLRRARIQQRRRCRVREAEQIDTKLFAFISRIRPRRALIVDEQKRLVAAFPMFVLDGTRRGAPDTPPGLLQNMVTMETFAIRDGLIQHVEVFPFVSIPFGLGDGWTPGSGH